jgi:hypothetical protein
MAHNVSLIGVQPDELPWMRLLISLLRHPDNTIPELARQALMYLAETSGPLSISPSEEGEAGPCREIQYHSGRNLVS